jgi:signal transduction histidine kinase
MAPPRVWSLRARLNVAACVVFVLAAMAVVLLVNRQQRAAALRVSEKRANAIVERNLAIHEFYVTELQPAVRALAERAGGASFDPVWMSSAYAARRIDSLVPSAGGVYSFKECAIGARNPASEADEFERAFLEGARRDAAVERWSGLRTIDGAPFFAVLRRGKTVEGYCLECHSSPERAPEGLVARYGAIGGFGRQEGELVSALSVRIPLEATFADANAFSLKLSAMLVGVLAALFLAQWALYRTLLHGPLLALRRGAVRLASRSGDRAEPLPLPELPELRDVTGAFNAMSRSIARNTEELESKVEQRTRELMEREADLRQAQKMEAIGRLAGGVAHDFNNLLTAITGNAEVLAEELGPDSPRREEVEEIREAAVRAASLTRQLLVFSRRDVVQHRPLELDAVVSQLGRMLERLLPENVALALELGAGDACASGDCGQLEQVIVNLVVNARDAMPGGGCIRIETGRVAEDDPVAARDGVGAGRWLRLAVCDDGVGIDEGVLAHVFEPFFTTKPRDRGTGLGLATAYGIVQQHGGRIAVESELGAGASFRVYLPEASPAQEPPTLPAEPVSPACAGETILVAEDEAGVRRLAVATLRRHGYRVIEAASAEEALRLAACEPRIDLLVSDVVMSGMRGDELADLLRAERRHVAVVLMSGYAPDEDVRRRLGASGAGFLQKPFTPAELTARVARALAAGATRR